MKQELICIVCPKGCHLTAEQTAEGCCCFHIITTQHGKMQNGKDGTQMKATGIVRRIDELGRVVIPKEIRR